MTDDDTQPAANAVSQLDLERVALGEASDEERARIARKLARRGEDLDTRLEQLRQSNEEILSAYPADQMAARIEGRLEERKRSGRQEGRRGVRRSGRGRWFGGFGVLAAAAIAAFLVFDLPEEESPVDVVDSEETVRLKGAEPHLVIWRREAAEPVRLEENAAAGSGDVLQIEYQAAGAPHGVIASIDGRGAVTLHHPASADGDTRLQSGVEALDFGYQLDDAPHFERFFFVTSEEPLDVGEVTASLEELVDGGDARDGDPALSEHLEQVDFTVEKK